MLIQICLRKNLRKGEFLFHQLGLVTEDLLQITIPLTKPPTVSYKSPGKYIFNLKGAKNVPLKEVSVPFTPKTTGQIN